jgi:hypothetical protein
LFAKEMGCERIVAISRTTGKKADAIKMRATAFITTVEDHAGPSTTPIVWT